MAVVQKKSTDMSNSNKIVVRTRGRSYELEISKMMTVFGDSKTPNQKSVKLIEQSVKDFVRRTLWDAIHRSHVAGVPLSIEHILSPFRHDEERMTHIRRYFYWKNIVKMGRAPDPTAGAASVAYSSSGKPSVLSSGGSVRRKRPHLKFDFVSSLAEFSDSDVESENEGLDLAPPAKKRLKVLDSVIEGMTPEEYLEYSNARTSSFTYRSTQKFRLWASLDSFQAALDEDALDLLGFLAWERVGLVTQVALLAKRDQMGAHATEGGGGAAVPWTDAAVFGVGRGTPVLTSAMLDCPSLHPSRHSIVRGKGAVRSSGSLAPAHIREAVRRIRLFSRPPSLSLLASRRPVSPAQSS